MGIKEPTTYEQQIEILKSRGCIVADEADCIDFLRKVGYYRLSAYFLPFRRSDNTYCAGLTFEKVKMIYEFDSYIRHFLRTYSEELEIFLRSTISYYHAHRYGSMGYMQAENFNKKHKHDRFIANLQRVKSENKNNLSVEHHNKMYNGSFPIWAVIEIFSFGMLSLFYADLLVSDQKNISKEFFNGEPANNISSWLRCMTELRNRIAHHSRLYYWRFTSIPAKSVYEKSIPQRGLWDMITALKYLCPKFINWDSFCTELSAIVEKYSDFICYRHIGFPGDWEDILRKQ